MTPAEYAQQVIDECNISTAPALSLNIIFEHYHIICDELEYGDLNYSGSLHRKKDNAIILINTDIKNIGKINFTKAHEFGHFYLKHKGTEFKCSSSDLRLSDISIKPQEVEANQFASAFLMPKFMIEPIVLTSTFNFDTIRFVRDHFLVSKLSAAFKMLDYTRGNYALVHSQNGIIKHTKLSQSMACKIHLPHINQQLPEKSFANRVITSNVQIKDYVEINSSVWIMKNLQFNQLRVYENSRANKASNTCLTLLNFEWE